ncbi:hypothetical protein J5N97_000997 [Dioscorea zingiberensis]|uniref:Putative E3 ubiquitin-protein ligase LIN N-terminal domain-containing protein n=1 Tax=Dioscorea zingiberensis TaxID=325984 RepID=A0A9D5H2Q9_9LILI|nr:hypothetical protein J5N97_000997 [Dioscorea zingiberensis]
MVGFLGEVLGSDFNIAGFNWLSSPVAKELETLVMGWLAKALDMFDCFLFFDSGLLNNNLVGHFTLVVAAVETPIGSEPTMVKEKEKDATTAKSKRKLDHTRPINQGAEKADHTIGVQTRRTKILLSASGMGTSHSAQDREQLLIDEVFVRVVVSIISSYARRFSKDGEFHGSKRERSMECLAASKGAGHVVLTNLEMGMDSIERLASDPPVFALS